MYGQDASDNTNPITDPSGKGECNTFVSDESSRCEKGVTTPTCPHEQTFVKIVSMARNPKKSSCINQYDSIRLWKFPVFLQTQRFYFIFSFLKVSGRIRLFLSANRGETPKRSMESSKNVLICEKPHGGEVGIHRDT